jgi:ammonia channel protein AmtB
VIITAWSIFVAWIYFFAMKRCKVLRLKKEEEVLGMDMLENAKNKGIDIQQLLEAVSKMYPVSKRKGC